MPSGWSQMVAHEVLVLGAACWGVSGWHLLGDLALFPSCAYSRVSKDMIKPSLFPSGGWMVLLNTAFPTAALRGEPSLAFWGAGSFTSWSWAGDTATWEAAATAQMHVGGGMVGKPKRGTAKRGRVEGSGFRESPEQGREVKPCRAL